MSYDISHYFLILHNEQFNEVKGTVGRIYDWVSEKFRFETTWGFSEKKCVQL